MRETWILIDSRTDKRCQMACYLNEAQARAAIAGYVDRDKRGGRPDISHLVPYMDTRLIEDRDRNEG